jgi:hypothetical protein
MSTLSVFEILSAPAPLQDPSASKMPARKPFLHAFDADLGHAMMLRIRETLLAPVALIARISRCVPTAA